VARTDRADLGHARERQALSRPDRGRDGQAFVM